MNKIVKILAFISIMSMVGILAFNCGGSTSTESTTDSATIVTDTTVVSGDTTAVSGGAGVSETTTK